MRVCVPWAGRSASRGRAVSVPYSSPVPCRRGPYGSSTDDYLRANVS